MSDQSAHTAGGTSLVYMANQIATFFGSQGDRNSAITGVAGHIKDFWSPAMRRDALALLEQSPADGLSDIARAAILSLK